MDYKIWKVNRMPKKYNYTMKTGRPTDYDPKLILEVKKYLTEAVPENMDIPTIEGLAIRLDVSKDSLYEWSKKHKEFSDALRRLKIEQKNHLIKIGIFGGKEINANIVALMLKVNHKMVETKKQNIKLEQVTPLLANVPNNYSSPKAEETNQEN